MPKNAKQAKTYKGILFKVYVFIEQPVAEQQQGTITLTDERFTDTGHKAHFNYFDEIPRKMRKLMKEANRKPSRKKDAK